MTKRVQMCHKCWSYLITKSIKRINGYAHARKECSCGKTWKYVNVDPHSKETA